MSADSDRRAAVQALNPFADCDHCGQKATWQHFSSEIQVNKALRAPDHFLNPEHAERFVELQAFNDALKVSVPEGGLHAAVQEWIRSLKYLVNHQSRRRRNWRGASPA